MPSLQVGELVSGADAEQTTAREGYMASETETKASKVDRSVASAHESKNERVKVSLLPSPFTCPMRKDEL